MKSKTKAPVRTGRQRTEKTGWSVKTPVPRWLIVNGPALTLQDPDKRRER